MDVNQKVYNTRATFLESVAVLEEEVEVSSNLNTRPVSIEAHSKQSCQQAHLGKKGVCEAVGQPWNTEASGRHMVCVIANVGKKHNASISRGDSECKDVRGEIKEALGQEGKEEQQEGSGEFPGLDDSQKRLNMLQTHAHVLDRRVAGQDEGRGGRAMVLCNDVLEGNVQGIQSFFRTSS